jgi:hypothetical protein
MTQTETKMKKRFIIWRGWSPSGSSVNVHGTSLSYLNGKAAFSKEYETKGTDAREY